MMKVADLEKLLLQKDKDLQLIRVSLAACGDGILLALPRTRGASLHRSEVLEIRFREPRLNYYYSK